jgi:hypothetical protein
MKVQNFVVKLVGVSHICDFPFTSCWQETSFTPKNTMKQVVNLHLTKQSFLGNMDSVLYRHVYLSKHNISLQQNTALPYHNRIDLHT